MDTSTAPRTLMLVAVAAALAGTASASAIPDSLTTALDAYVAPLAGADQLSGNLLVARGDEVVYQRSFGMADYNARIPNTPETRFCVASVTKPMTLVIAVRLIEEGKIGMNDPLEKWIPGFPRGDEITFLHVLRHRAGLPHRVTTPAEEAAPTTSEEMVARVIAAVQRGGFLCEPGEKSIYSSAGYSVAARLCELASGESYEALLERYVFAPAGMKRSVDASVGAANLPRHAGSYTDTWPGERAAEAKDYSFLVGAGSVFSTASDVYGFLRAIVDTTYGAGVRASLLRDGVIDENGITNGYRSFADYDEASDTYIVFTGNRFTGATEWLRRDVPRILAGEEVATPEIPRVARVALSDAQLHRLEGSFESDAGSNFDVTTQNGLVYAGWYALIPTSETTFFSPEDYATVTFTFQGGRATRLEWATPGSADGPRVWTRVEE